MPRTKRRFADDDPPSDEDSSDDPEEEEVFRSRSGGKQLRMMGGGKQLVRPPPSDDDDSDSDSESEEEAAPPPVYRGGGKQFRPGGGKQLRVPEPDSDSEEEDEDDDDDEEVHVPVHRGGGKSLMGMQHRGGGKQLRPMVQDDDEDSDSDESEEEEEAPTRQPQPSFGGGKQLRRPPPKEESEDDEEEVADDMDIDSDDDDDEEEEKPQQVAAAPYRGGKTLSRPMGGKQLHRPPPSPEPAKPEPPKQAEPEDMEESSDDESSDEERELDMETLDPQALVQDAEDQKYLDSLPEFEREAILGERFEKLKNAADMKKALRESKRKEREEKRAAKATKTGKKKASKTTKSSKKAATDTSGDAALAEKLSAARESQRNRDAKGAKKKKEAALAAFREDKQRKVEREEEEDESELDFGDDDDDDDSDDDYKEESFVKPWQQKKKTLRQSSQLSREDSEYSSEDEEGEEALPTKLGREKGAGPEAELADYIKVTIPRRRLAQWCNEPYFEDIVMNCFVRLGIGEIDGKKCYRLCEIVGVVPSKSEYKFPATNKHSRPISTSKALKLKIGKNEKEFPMYLISDSRPTDEDMRKYVEIQRSQRKEVLSKRRAMKLRKNLDELVHNYRYTNEDINRAIEARKRSGKGMANIGSEQTRIKIAVQGARSSVEEAQRRLDEAKKTLLEFSGDDAEADALERNVESAEADLESANKILEERLVEEEKVKVLAKDRKRRLNKRAKDRNWAKVNERAAMVNQAADFDSYKADRERLKSAAKNADGTEKFNPYARRKVKPKMLWEVGQNKEGATENGDGSNAKETRDEAVTDTPKVASNGRDENDKNSAVQQEDLLGTQKAELVGESHQFAIDEEVLAQSSPNGSSLGAFGLNSTKKKIARVRKGLSFAEYLERKTAGTL